MLEVYTDGVNTITVEPIATGVKVTIVDCPPIGHRGLLMFSQRYTPGAFELYRQRDGWRRVPKDKQPKLKIGALVI